MSQKYFQIIRPVHVHLKMDKVDLKKRPPWKKIILHIFSIHSSSRTEKRCQMLQTLFLLFPCCKNPRCKLTSENCFCCVSTVSIICLISDTAKMTRASSCFIALETLEHTIPIWLAIISMSSWCCLLNIQ